MLRHSFRVVHVFNKFVHFRCTGLANVMNVVPHTVYKISSVLYNCMNISCVDFKIISASQAIALLVCEGVVRAIICTICLTYSKRAYKNINFPN